MAAQFQDMCENNREEFDYLQGCSSATFEMLLPHDLYRDREGMDEYYEHTVRKIADNLTLQEVECTEDTLLDLEGESDTEEEEKNNPTVNLS